ncbi:MAG: hypothetical protein PHS32_12460 [Rhodoferax sp.]|uniref:hypothetical protein n=1 Tax=Rhodoferax sp. TaxID=50421 RepID=UPI0026036222|nr:hypothetical protein [Rhodoferax sp.]MDD5334544.1 hypothetical protein [Rhodoferax sp.]
MNALPAASTGSRIKGLWFVFSLGKNTIRGWSSILSGLERIYVDNALVSERRSWAKSSKHTFAVAGEEYAVAFRTISILEGHIECSLLKDGQAKQTYLAKYLPRKPISIVHLLLGLAAGFGVGFLTGHFQRSLWTILGFVFLVHLVRERTRETRSFSIEEIKPA